MHRYSAIGLIAAVFVLAGTFGGATPAAAYEHCLYSGPLTLGVFHNSDPPVRVELEANNRAVDVIRKVQTNYDPSNPFRPGVFAEKPTCRLRLDCIVPRQGLQKVGLNALQFGNATDNVWIERGSAIDFTYAAPGHRLTCHVSGVDVI